MSLVDRARELHAEAHELLIRLNLATAFPWPPILIGSALSGLMVDRDLDVMFDAPDANAGTILQGLITLDHRVGIRTIDFRDERADRRPTPALTDERFYAVLHTDTWKIDLTFWLHVVERPHVVDAHRVRDATDEQSLRILQLKDTTPDRDSSAIYRAVLGAG
jgi:hypothetical protein